MDSMPIGEFANLITLDGWISNLVNQFKIGAENPLIFSSRVSYMWSDNWYTNCTFF